MRTSQLGRGSSGLTHGQLTQLFVAKTDTQHADYRRACPLSGVVMPALALPQRRPPLWQLASRSEESPELLCTNTLLPVDPKPELMLRTPWSRELPASVTEEK